MPKIPGRRFAAPVRLMVMLTRGVCRAIPLFFAIALAEVVTPLAMRPGPPSFSLAKMKLGIAYGDVLASIHCLCALNANVSALERSLICHAS